MTKINDQKIMELKKQIEEKKEKMVKAKKFTPVTNCSIEVELLCIISKGSECP